jgi:hypothetical protein
MQVRTFSCKSQVSLLSLACRSVPDCTPFQHKGAGNYRDAGALHYLCGIRNCQGTRARSATDGAGMSDQLAAGNPERTGDDGRPPQDAAHDAPGVTADLVLAAGTSQIDGAADPGQFVIAACGRAALLPRAAVERADITQVAELRSQAEAVRVYAAQKHLGREAEMAAAEVVRRAERGLAQMIREGQATGRVRQRADGGWHAREVDGTGGTHKISSGDVLGRGRTRAEMYAMSGGVSDEDFEDALHLAKAEDNLARASLVRKIRQRRVPARHDDGQPVPEPGDTSDQAQARRAELVGRWAGQGVTSRRMGWWPGITDQEARRIAVENDIRIPADRAEVERRMHRPDANTIMHETVTTLTGFADTLPLIEPGDLDPALVPGWASSMLAVLPRFEKFARSLLCEKTDE